MLPALPVVLTPLPCKLCGRPAEMFGSVDFNKNCEASKKRFPLPAAGIQVYYHRCSFCELMFTVAFDSFSNQDFSTYIYNSQYELVDPEYAAQRPMGNAKLLADLFSQSPHISILDYGAGNGKLSGALRSIGFNNVESYDPFVPAHSLKPSGKFDLIVAYEVVEHTPTPMQTFEEMLSLLNPEGIVLFSTLTQPPNIREIGLKWWYVSPRNGHVTIYSARCLQMLAKHLKMSYASSGPGTHLLFTKVPPFAKHLLTVA